MRWRERIGRRGARGSSPPRLLVVPRGAAGVAGAPRRRVDAGRLERARRRRRAAGRDRPARSSCVQHAFSLADRVARAGGLATRRRRAALDGGGRGRAAAVHLEARAAQGVSIRPEFRFTRDVLNGFSAALDPRAIALLERDAAA